MTVRAAAFVLVAFAAVPLSGCMTPRAKVAPSPAVVAARAHAGAKVAACPAGDLADVSPAVARFAFDKAEVDEVGVDQLTRVAAWLACNPTTPVIILPSADNHGDAAHQQALSDARAQAVAAELRTLGAKTAVIRLLPAGAADPLAGAHVMIQAAGRGW